MEKLNKRELPILRKCENTYKLIIPSEVEKKIRHLCNKISQVEWSGTLFYIVTGSYEDNNLEIRCTDIFPMDIGSATYTEFDMSPDVIAYMTEHQELLECQVGLIHSHNTMASFFSGTDISTLREEGTDRNHFVSLIVNNEGTYTAAITRKIIETKTINSSYKYNTFDDITKEGTKTYIEEEEVIEYNYLTIIKEGEVVNSFAEIDQRLSDIKAAKDKAKREKEVELPKFNNYNYNNNNFTNYYSNPPSFNNKYDIVKQQSLFDFDYIDNKPSKIVSSADPNEEDIVIPTSVVNSITLQLITGSIAIADSSRIDPKKWAKQMVKLFDKRFETIDIYSLWAETMVEFVLTTAVPSKYKGYYEEDYINALSSSVYSVINSLPTNKYLEILKDTLILWIQ